MITPPGVIAIRQAFRLRSRKNELLSLTVNLGMCADLAVRKTPVVVTFEGTHLRLMDAGLAESVAANGVLIRRATGAYDKTRLPQAVFMELPNHEITL